MTTREHFAGMAMQGLLSNHEWCNVRWRSVEEGETMASSVAKSSVELGDALISKLNNTDSNERLLEIVGKLLNHCPDSECPECSKISCPHGCELHFHHDGCPACAMEPELARAEPTRTDSLRVEPDEDGWIEHDPSGPVPKVYSKVRFKDGDEIHSSPGTWLKGFWDHTPAHNHNYITHYKP